MLLLLRSISFDQVMDALTKISVLDYSFVLALQISILIISVFKWRLFLPRVSFVSLLRWFIMAQFFHMATPGQLGGEFVKIIGLRKDGQRSSYIAACAFIDKMTTLAALMLFTSLGALISPNSGSIPLVLRICAAGMFFGIFTGYLLLVKLKWPGIKKAVCADRKFLGKVVKFCSDLSSDIRNSGRKFVLVGVSMGLSVLSCFLLAGKVAVIGNSGMLSVLFVDWCWIVGMLTVIMLFPFSVGGLGVREGGYVVALSFLSVSAEKALALSMVLFTVQLICASVGFLFFMYETHQNKKRNKNAASYSGVTERAEKCLRR